MLPCCVSSATGQVPFGKAKPTVHGRVVLRRRMHGHRLQSGIVAPARLFVQGEAPASSGAKADGPLAPPVLLSPSEPKATRDRLRRGVVAELGTVVGIGDQAVRQFEVRADNGTVTAIPGTGRPHGRNAARSARRPCCAGSASRRCGPRNTPRPRSVVTSARLTPRCPSSSENAQTRQERGWCPGAESNHRHCDFQSHALPTELPGPKQPPHRGRGRGPGI